MTNAKKNQLISELLTEVGAAELLRALSRSCLIIRDDINNDNAEHFEKWEKAAKKVVEAAEYAEELGL